MHNLLAALSFLALMLSAESHVYMGYPPTFGANSVSTDDLISPMNGGPTHPDQWPFPCKGFHIANSEVQPDVVWKAGDTVKFRLFDSDGTSEHRMGGLGAVHSGGSCQISFSYDRGLTWVVVQSFEGDCPRVRPGMKGTVTNLYDPNQDYYFKIPETFPSGDYVIVAWTWINATGNREFYMSCSPVKITGSGPSTNVTPEGHPLLIANLSPLSDDKTQADALSQCRTEDSTSVEYPDRYDGFNAVIRAPIALNFQPFPGGNTSVCGSDNAEIVQALGESSEAQTSSISSSISSLVLPEQLVPSSATWFPATNATPASLKSALSATVSKGSSGCTHVETSAFSPDSPPLSTFSGGLQTDRPSSTEPMTPDPPSSTALNEQTKMPDLGVVLSELHPMLTSALTASNGQISTLSPVMESNLHLATAVSPSNSCVGTVTTTVGAEIASSV